MNGMQEKNLCRRRKRRRILKVWLKKVGGNERLKNMYDENDVKKTKHGEEEGFLFLYRVDLDRIFVIMRDGAWLLLGFSK